jgi:poly(A) polymerase
MLDKDGALAEGVRGDFVRMALEDTDRRVGEGRSVSPSFMLACMLWHEVLQRWTALRASGEAAMPALQQAIDTVFDARIGDISGRGKLAIDMREIWMMQPRFERRSGNGVYTLVDQPRYRAGFDFLRLRADAGEIDPALADWWEDFALGSDDDRSALLDDAREAEKLQQRGRASGPKVHQLPRKESAAAATTSDAPEEAGEGGDAEFAPAKKRRRRRKPKVAGAMVEPSAAAE